MALVSIHTECMVGQSFASHGAEITNLIIVRIFVVRHLILGNHKDKKPFLMIVLLCSQLTSGFVPNVLYTILSLR